MSARAIRLASARPRRQKRLVHADDTKPGIARRRQGRSGFAYVRPDGRRVKSAADVQRINSLAIPPAWTDVWICPHANGHLQATGRDARGRKQHRYHPDWIAQRDEAKYERILDFARRLPALRRRVSRDLGARGLPRQKVLAAVIRLLERTLIRVGNDEYARDNNSYGLTTLLDRHAAVKGEAARFRFRGKSGKTHEVELSDRRLARIVKQCRDLPGSQLFQYVDDDGHVRDVGSGDVNEYLRQVTGESFSAKDFRTWAATVLTAQALDELKQFDSSAHAERNIKAAIDAVAKVLGNTRAVCRRSYVHPEILNAYLDRSLARALRGGLMARLQDAGPRLSRPEAAVLALLHRRLGRRPAASAAA
ncbi:MAG: DNA topoisomerase IB [Acidobacteria bacterium]|nr:DNA topoisomerase IB [Acidobacteriota bacterium]